MDKQIDKHEGIKIMSEEHRALAAVLHALEYLAKPQQLAKTDVRVFQAIVRYIDTYSEKLHHPAEDRFLFKPLKEKTKEGDELIAQLEAEHARGGERMRKLKAALDQVIAGTGGSDVAFGAAVEEYAQFYWQHMTLEEKNIFPLAANVLSQEDWAALVEGFNKNKDPIAGSEAAKDMDALLRKILEIAPEPIGLG